MRIFLADDQPKVLFALRTLLERCLGLQVVGEAAHMDGMRQQLEETCPDLLLLDWRLRGPRPDNWITSLHSRCPGLRVIALSGHSEDNQAALKAGADAFVCKCDPPERLLRAVEALCAGSAPANTADELAADTKAAHV
jgi:DNA-binding NarL/FixJ family response regulator